MFCADWRHERGSEASFVTKRMSARCQNRFKSDRNRKLTLFVINRSYRRERRTVCDRYSAFFMIGIWYSSFVFPIPFLQNVDFSKILFIVAGHS